MTSPTVQFLFDFGSPNAYLCHKVIPEIEARTGSGLDLGDDLVAQISIGAAKVEKKLNGG